MSKQKLLRCLCLVASALLFGGGCGGIKASKSVSPLDFILPGLMQNVPAPLPEGEALKPDAAVNLS